MESDDRIFQRALVRKVYNSSFNFKELLDEETDEYNTRQDEKTEREAKSFLKVKPTFSLVPPY